MSSESHEPVSILPLRIIPVKGPESLTTPADQREEVIDLYIADLHALRIDLPRWHTTLSSEEKQQVLQMADRKAAEQITCSFAIRRWILARYLAIPPGEIRFLRLETGKPYIAQGDRKTPKFNLSHSKDLMMTGISISREIGVDIQFMDMTVPVLQIAARFFSSEDIRYIESGGGTEPYTRFYRVWTFLEAFSKATGEGLVRGMNHFFDRPDFSQDAGEITIKERQWQWQLLSFRDRYQCCVVVSLNE